KAPVLNNFTDLLLNRHYVNKGSLKDAYNSLELYTSQLVYNQLKGVNLVVEAEHINGDKASALAYLQEYQNNILNEEIGTPGNGVSFIYNTWRMALLNMDIYPSDGSSYFSQEIQDILKRAEFYKVQTLREKYFSLRILLFRTQDIGNLDDLYVKNSDVSYMLDCQKVDVNMSGKAYDFWNSDNEVKPVNTYDAYTCLPSENPEDVELGTYKVYYGSPDTSPIGEVSVEKYDENYTVKSDGNITYGHTTIFMRSPMNHFPQVSEHWSLQKHSGTNTYISGSANNWPIEIYFHQHELELGFFGSTELDGHFYYTGNEDKLAEVTYHTEYYLEASVSADAYPGERTTVSYQTGIYNATNHNSECQIDYSLYAVDGESYSEHRNITHHCKFTAKPGHHYYVYFKMSIEGRFEVPDPDTKLSATSRMEKVDSVYVKFID
ncbi:MAG: hypothetical protein KAI17_27475, partial [Thiotrichaceae bacterium]|nr:hypothetical protein [Thiotrichaceae bacterium]